MARFTNKVVLVTGAGSGVGKAAAIAFAKEGAMTVVVDKNAEAAIAVAQMVGEAAIAVTTDVTSPDEVENMIGRCLDRFGRIDVAFNNAGVGGKLAPIWETSLNEWRRVISTNLESIFLCMQAEAKAMMASGGGAIVNMSSIAGLVAAPGLSEYAASKHGVVGLSKAAALDLIDHGVRVNVVCPGTVDTPMLNTNDVTADAAEQFYSGIPMGRIARPEEVVSAVLYLASEEASYVVGHAMPIDGGVLAR